MSEMIEETNNNIEVIKIQNEDRTRQTKMKECEVIEA